MKGKEKKIGKEKRKKAKKKKEHHLKRCLIRKHVATRGANKLCKTADEKLHFPLVPEQRDGHTIHVAQVLRKEHKRR